MDGITLEDCPRRLVYHLSDYCFIHLIHKSQDKKCTLYIKKYTQKYKSLKKGKYFFVHNFKKYGSFLKNG